MIEIRHLDKCNGASRFGSCANCGAGSSDDKKMTWIEFTPHGGNQQITICLCSRCRIELASAILTNALIEDELS